MFARKYEFQFTSEVSHSEVLILLLKDGYSGPSFKRALGQAPVFSREKNGRIHGMCVQMFAECLVEGEFAEIYTGKWRMDVFRNSSKIFEGMVVPELYSEPDILPPYDVEITATDGVGELKYHYPDEIDMTPTTIADYFYRILNYEGTDSAIYHNCRLSSSEGQSGVNLMNMTVDLSHYDGNLYDLLVSLLESINADLTKLDNETWGIIRVNDLYSRGSVFTFGSMQTNDWWPIGHMNSAVEAAKNAIEVSSPITPISWKHRDFMSSVSKTSNVSYDAASDVYTMPGFSASVTLNMPFIPAVDMEMSVKARCVLTATKLKIDVTAMDGSSMVYWNPQLGVWDDDYSPIEVNVASQDFTEQKYIIGYAEATRRGLTNAVIRINDSSADNNGHVSELYDIRMQAKTIPGYKDLVRISNASRTAATSVEVLFPRVTASTIANIEKLIPAVLIARNGVPATTLVPSYGGLTDILASLAKDHAKTVAGARLRKRGKLNTPASITTLPLRMRDAHDSQIYFVDTFKWDLLNDEIDMDMISAPSVTLTVVSEVITPIS